MDVLKNIIEETIKQSDNKSHLIESLYDYIKAKKRACDLRKIEFQKKSAFIKAIDEHMWRNKKTKNELLQLVDTYKLINTEYNKINYMTNQHDLFIIGKYRYSIRWYYNESNKNCVYGFNDIILFDENENLIDDIKKEIKKHNLVNTNTEDYLYFMLILCDLEWAYEHIIMINEPIFL